MRNVASQLKLEQANYVIDTIADLSTIPIIAIDGRGTVIKFSDAAVQTFGWTAKEMLGSNIKKIQPPEVADKHDNYLKNYARTGFKVVLDNMVRQEALHKDGRRFPIDLIIREIKNDGQNSLFIGYARDASDEVELQRAMNVSSKVLQLSPMPMIIMDRKGIVTEFNESSAKLFGYEATKVIGQNIKMLMPEEVAKFHDNYLKQYLKTRIRSVIDSPREVTAVRSNGEHFPVELLVSEVIAADPKNNRYLGYVRDLTQVNEMKRQSLVSEQVASIIQVPLIIIDENGTIQRYSKSAAACFGYSEEAVLGENVKKLMPTEVAEKHDGYLARCKERGQGTDFVNKRLKGRRKNGELFVVGLSVRSVSLGDGKNCYVGLIKDIAAQQVDLSTASMREKSMNVSPIPLICITPNGNITTVNEATETLFGYTEKECVGRNVKMLMPKDTADLHDKYLAEYMRTGVKKVLAKKEVRVVGKRKNGEKIKLSLSLLEIKSGQEHYFMGQLRDVTEELEALTAAELLQVTMASSTDAMICIRPCGTVLRFNEAAAAVFQYRREEVLGKNIQMLMPERYAKDHDSFLQRYMTTKVKRVVGKTTKNLRGLRKDGKEIAIELLVEEVPALNEVQETIFTAVLKPVEEDARLDEENRVSALSLKFSQKAVLAISEGGQLLVANPAACRLFGYRESELLDKNVKMLMPLETAEQHDGYLARYKRTGEKRVVDQLRQVVGRHRNGTRISLELQIKETFTSTGKSVYVGFLDDLGYVKRKLYIPKFSPALMASSINPIVVINTKGIIQEFNAAAENLFEFTQSQVLGKNVNILMPREMHITHDTALQRYLETREKKVIDNQLDVTGETKSGAPRKLTLRVKEIEQVGGEALYIGCFQLRQQ